MVSERTDVASSLHTVTSMRLSVALAFVAFTACTQQETIVEKTPEEIELQGARTRFDTNMAGAYSFHTSRSCECTAEATREMLVTVEGGAITSAIYVDDATAVPLQIRNTLMTIEETFDEIENAIATHAHAVSVVYDSELGFPSSVAIDYDAQVADEELSLLISQVRPVPVPGCGVAPCG